MTIAWSGGRSPATLWTLVVSRASSSVSGGQIPGMRLASIDLPLPGGPIIRTLCPPATATSMGALHVLLALHIGEVVLDRIEFAEDFVGIDAHRQNPDVTGEKIRRLAQMPDRIDIQSGDDGGLRGVNGGNEKSLLAVLAGGKCDGQCALDRPAPRR